MWFNSSTQSRLVQFMLASFDHQVFDGKQWGEMTPMISNRCRHGSVVFQGQLWAVGGYNGRFLSSVEQYSFASGQWTPMTATMNVRRGRVGVVTSGSKGKTSLHDFL